MSDKQSVELFHHVNKSTMNRWLCESYDKGKSWEFIFDYGSASLGSPWIHLIPVTGLLLAGIRSKKVEINAEFGEARLVGGFTLRIKRTGDITPEDFEGMMVTRNQFELKRYEEN